MSVCKTRREDSESKLLKDLSVKGVGHAVSQPLIQNVIRHDNSPIRIATYIQNGNKFLQAYEPNVKESKPVIRPFSGYKKRSNSSQNLPKPQSDSNSKAIAFLHSSILTAPFGQPIRGKKMKDTSDFGVMFRQESSHSHSMSRLKERYKEIPLSSLKRSRFLRNNLHK